MSGAGTRLAGTVGWIGLFSGPAAAVLAYFLMPAASFDESGEIVSGLSPAGRATASVGVLMAMWWLSEAIPLSATSLVPLVLFPLTGAASVGAAAAPFANQVIFLFMGGFILGLGMERWGLHKRIALLTVLVVGTSPRRMIAGFMVAAAVLSMWVSNTATTIMMLPIATSVIALVAAQHAPQGTRIGEAESPDTNFDVSLLLGIAYASSIGGVATLIGTAPNGILAGFARDTLERPIDFANWMMMSLPLVATMLVVSWLYITTLSQPVRLKEIPGGRRLIRGELHALGRMKRGEWVVLVVFLCTVTLWLSRQKLQAIGAERGWPVLEGLNDASIAIAAAIALFATPVHARDRVFAMDWNTASRLPWGILLLFGGGLSLASALSANGVDVFIGGLFQGLEGAPLWVAVLVICAAVVFLTELTSNTAVTTALLPILGGAAVAMGYDPMRLVVPAAIAASMAFMLPVATPPNAIVFGSGRIRIGQMARAGLGLNLMSIVAITAATMLMGDAILAVSRGP